MAASPTPMARLLKKRLNSEGTIRHHEFLGESKKTDRNVYRSLIYIYIYIQKVVEQKGSICNMYGILQNNAKYT